MEEEKYSNNQEIVPVKRTDLFLQEGAEQNRQMHVQDENAQR